MRIFQFVELICISRKSRYLVPVFEFPLSVSRDIPDVRSIKYVALTGARNYAIVYYIMSSTWILPESPTWYIGFFFTVCLCRMRTIRPREPSTLVHPSSRRVACGCFASLVARSPSFPTSGSEGFFSFLSFALKKIDRFNRASNSSRLRNMTTPR